MKLLISILCVCLPATALSEELRLDLGADTNRNDTRADHWQEWPIETGTASTSLSVKEIEVTIRPANAPLLQSLLSKRELAVGAALVSDGVFVGGQPGNSLMISLKGLSPGRHTITTFHHWIWKDPREPEYRVSCGKSVAKVSPSIDLQHDDDCRTAHLEIEVPDSGEALVQIELADSSSNSKVVLNGLVVDGHNPQRQALKPVPADRDEHVPAANGKVKLSWKSSGAAAHRVYLSAADSYEQASAALTPDNPNESLLVATTKETSFKADVVDYDSLKHYAWRVDEVDSAGTITRGRIWTFRLRHIAFPGAEGYGRFALGGRGGKVFIVTNLNDAGPGSLREAIEAEGPRTVIFEVGGLISLKSGILIRNPYITIAGQTAPGKGICVRNYNIGGFGCHDIVMRYMRLRLGDLANRPMDGTGLASCDHSIYDHLSVSWALDETISTRNAGNITIQRSIVSEALLNHPRYSGGYAGSIGGDVASLHHNLLAHNAGRNWSLAGALDKAGRHQGRLDLRNNVVYNWIKRTNDGGAMLVQIVNNYYKPGPASQVFHVLDPERNHVFGPQDYYVSGNVVEGHYSADGDDWAPIVEPKNEPLSEFVYREPFFDSHVQTHSADEAYDAVLSDVGCNVPTLDEHDQRIIREVRDGTTTFVGSLTKTPGVINSQEDSGGWEDYPEVHRPHNWDTDRDGIPNEWEAANGLNPNDPTDRVSDHDQDGYTAIEHYLQSLVKAKP